MTNTGTIKTALAANGYNFVTYNFQNAAGESVNVSYSRRSESAYLTCGEKKLRISNHPQFSGDVELGRVNNDTQKDVRYADAVAAINWLVS